MPDVAPHVFIVGECRDRPNVLRFQAIADRLPGQLSEDGQFESPDAAFRWRRCGWLGLAKAFWNSGSAWMNLMRATFARAACGMSSRFASPRLILRSRDFRTCVVTRLKRTLAFWVFGYVEPGTAAAAALGMRQPFCSRGGARSPLFPSLSHRLTPGCRRLLFAVRFFGGSGGHPFIKIFGNIRAQDYPLCVWSRGADCRRRSRCTCYAFGRLTADHL